MDAIGIDKDGDIYCIETKLYKNPDKRLVVAQVLDYGASLWRSYLDFTDFTRRIDEAAYKTFGVGFSRRIGDFFSVEEDEIASIIESAKQNLNAGKFKFVILMDKLHDPLKNLIVFLNQNSRFDIYAVEMDFYKYDKYEIMIPRLFGAEVKKDIGASSPGTKRKWDEDSFLSDSRTKLNEQSYAAVFEMLKFSKEVGAALSWGTGNTRASFSAKFHKIAQGSLYTVRSNGVLSANFGWLVDNERSEMYRDEFAKDLKSIPELNIPERHEKVYPSIPVERWGPRVDRIKDSVRRLLSI